MNMPKIECELPNCKCDDRFQSAYRCKFAYWSVIIIYVANNVHFQHKLGCLTICKKALLAEIQPIGYNRQIRQVAFLLEIVVSSYQAPCLLFQIAVLLVLALHQHPSRSQVHKPLGQLQHSVSVKQLHVSHHRRLKDLELFRAPLCAFSVPHMFHWEIKIWIGKYYHLSVPRAHFSLPQIFTLHD